MNFAILHKVTRLLFGFILLGCALSANGLFAQNQIHGRVLNAKTQETIPFVHIVIKGKSGTVSNIEGKYTLPLPAEADDNSEVSFSCVGYTPIRESVNRLKQNPVVYLHPDSTNLAEVVIRAKDDPAYALMEKVVENRKKNNPEEIPHFKFTSYNKASIDVIRTDTIQAELAKTGFKDAHLLMLESATEVIYQKPGKWSEKVVAGKISGIKNSAIMLVSNSFQPFSCYDNYINISGFDYLNPISPNSRARYNFALRDSAVVEDKKVYIIQFTPRQSASEELIKGMLTITADTYALVHFHAQNRDDYKLMIFEIKQAYSRVNGHWFPKESNTTYILPNKDTEIDLIASSTTFIRDTDLNYEPEKRDFAIAQIRQSAAAAGVADTTWERLRNAPLSLHEENTYAVYDTLPTGIINTINWFANFTTSLIQGRINLGKINLLPQHILRLNLYEGVRLGLGIETSDKLVKWARLHAYGAYGFKDKAWKYGAGTRFFIYPKREVELALNYKSDLMEPGRDRFIKDIGFLNAGEVVRNLYARRMEEVKKYETILTWRPTRGWRVHPFFTYQELNLKNLIPDVEGIFTRRGSSSAQFGLELRFIPGEKLMQTGKSFSELNMSFPRIRFKTTHSTAGILNSNVEFTKAQIEFEHEFKLRGLGTTRLYGHAAKLWGNGIAYPYLISGRGVRGKEDMGLAASGYFQTMDSYRFFADEYIQGGIIHNFGSIFGIRKSFSKPELKIAYTAAIGSLNPKNSKEIPFDYQKISKPYLEAGLMIDNLLRMSSSFYYSGYGLGVFYNHGAYEEPQFLKNVSAILTFSISL